MSVFDMLRRGAGALARDGRTGAGYGALLNSAPVAYGELTDGEPGADLAPVLEALLMGGIVGTGLGTGAGAAIRGGGAAARGLSGLISDLRAARAPTAVATAPVADEALAAARLAPPRQYSNEELRAMGAGPSPRYGSGAHRMDAGRANPMTEMSEMQAMRDALVRLRQARRMAETPEELDDIDLNIAVIRRDLGLEPWE